MEMKIGTTIAQLRKAKSMTQEQLAEKLGISAPAISKWETDSSYPDITLLCPLARALDTTVDKLLQFEESLTDTEAQQKIKTVMDILKQQGSAAAEAELLCLLHRYPNSVELKFNAAAALATFNMYSITDAEEGVQRRKNLQKKLLNDVRNADSSRYTQMAVHMLAQYAIQDGELEQAETLLQALPEVQVDTAPTWAVLYLQKNEPDQALITLQKRLYALVNQSKMLLGMMLNESILPDIEREMQICHTFCTLEHLFDNGETSAMYEMELHLRRNDPESAVDALERYVDFLIHQKIALPKPEIFSPGVQIPIIGDASKQLRKLVLTALETEESSKGILTTEKGRAIIEKLKNSL